MQKNLSIPYVVFAYHLAASLLLGALIGAERQRRQRTAGLRTNALVCSGAAMFVLLARLLSASNDSTLRVAAQIVSGIGFLAGGVILREGFTIQGLNTAATLWCSAAVGSLCGAGFLAEGGISVAVVLAANLWLRPLARKIERPRTADEDAVVHCSLLVVCRSEDESHLRPLILSMITEDQKLTLQALHSADVEHAAGKLEIRATLIAQGRQDLLLERIVSRISLEPGVSAVSWNVTLQESEA
jgi:putative Mg2+ transporter-C (MgtC) family protein